MPADPAAALDLLGMQRLGLRRAAPRACASASRCGAPTRTPASASIAHGRLTAVGLRRDQTGARPGDVLAQRLDVSRPGCAPPPGRRRRRRRSRSRARRARPSRGWRRPPPATCAGAPRPPRRGAGSGRAGRPHRPRSGRSGAGRARRSGEARSPGPTISPACHGAGSRRRATSAASATSPSAEHDHRDAPSSRSIPDHRQRAQPHDRAERARSTSGCPCRSAPPSTSDAATTRVSSTCHGPTLAKPWCAIPATAATTPSSAADRQAASEPARERRRRMPPIDTAATPCSPSHHGSGGARSGSRRRRRRSP